MRVIRSVLAVNFAHALRTATHTDAPNMRHPRLQTVVSPVRPVTVRCIAHYLPRICANPHSCCGGKQIPTDGRTDVRGKLYKSSLESLIGEGAENGTTL